MTATSVKDVGSVMNLGAAAAAGSGKSVNAGFQKVWNAQSGKGTDAGKGAGQKKQADSQPAGASRPESAAKPGDGLKSVGRDKVRPDQGNMPEAKAPGEMTEEELEAAMEVMATAAAGLVEQIADAFGIPVEDVQSLMAEMDLQPLDLMQPDNLGDLLLEVSGAQDSLTLLTDEQLYADFQALMEQGRATVEQAGNELQMTPEEMAGVAEAMETIRAQEPIAVPEAADEPDVEITVRREEEPKPKSAAQDADIPADGRAGAQESDKAAVRETSGNPAADRRESGRGQARHGHQEGNPFLTDIRNETFRPQMQEVQEAARTWSADTQDIMRQVMDYLRIQVRSDVSNLEMQLHPASLGALQVQVASKGGVLTANFITQNEAVKAALESQMIQLRESFEEQGVKVEAIEVTVQTHQFEENLEQGQNRQSQEASGRRNRTRRIDLNGLDESDAADGMEPEDRLAAEMLAAGGGTVDYTA